MRVACLLVLALGALAACRPPAAELPRELGELAAGRTARAWVELTPQADLAALRRDFAARGAGRLARRAAVAAALSALAAESRAGLQPLLDDLRRRRQLHEVRALSVVNGLLVEATAEAFRELAKSPRVAALVAESESEVPGWAADRPPPPGDGRRTSWAIGAVEAEAAWSRGLDGGGVVVAAIDSGASAVHEQLRDGFLGGARGWRDPRGRSAEPRDGAFGHGTGVLSAAVGRNVGGVTLGVAPGARWSACAALPAGRYNNLRALDCADWVLDVARPDVLIAAWLLPGDPCDPALVRVVEAWRAAEILPVFAAGNLGPEPGANRSPANYAHLYPGSASALAVGGLTSAGELLPRSARGPGRCDARAPFPSLVAPAADVTTALPLTASTYRQADGTSYAAGFVAGAAAILLQRDPEASVAELEAALREGAVDLGPPGPDDRFGHGRLNVPGALAALARRPGTPLR